MRAREHRRQRVVDPLGHLAQCPDHQAPRSKPWPCRAKVLGPRIATTLDGVTCDPGDGKIKAREHGASRAASERDGHPHGQGDVRCIAGQPGPQRDAERSLTVQPV